VEIVWRLIAIYMTLTQMANWQESVKLQRKMGECCSSKKEQFF